VVIYREFLFYSSWGDTESLGTPAPTSLLYQLRMMDDGDCLEIGGMKIGRVKRSTRRSLPERHVTLSTTNPIWLDPGLNPGRRGGKPATNRLRYGAAHSLHLRFMVDWDHIFIICLAEVISDLLPVTQFPLKASALRPEVSDCVRISVAYVVTRLLMQEVLRHVFEM
jgi:hypothetical protein